MGLENLLYFWEGNEGEEAEVALYVCVGRSQEELDDRSEKDESATLMLDLLDRAQMC